MRLLKTLAILLVLLPLSSFAQGIRNTKHDLSFSSGNTALKNQSASANQICIYCHTPHRAQASQLLWNHAATATTVWNWGNDLDGVALTRTTNGTNLPTTLRSGSKRCLGCHDGTTAIGDVSNRGSGVSGIVAGLEGVGIYTDATGKLIDITHMVGTGGNMGGNHPVSVPYPTQTYNGITSSTIPADGTLGNFYAIVVGGTCSSTSGVCTSAPATDGRDGNKINLIPMLPGTTVNMGVECSTCHEPHNKYAPNPYFTRVDVSNASGLCRSCHNK